MSVCARIRRILHVDKTGHAGTLDPMAEGVLPVALGRATKSVSEVGDGTKTYEAGLLLGAAYLYSESLWMPIGIHWAWNFAEGNIFGFSVSGNEEMVSLLKPAINGPDIITGGAFGAEASILCVILGTLMTVYFLYLFKKKNQSAGSETQS